MTCSPSVRCGAVFKITFVICAGLLMNIATASTEFGIVLNNEWAYATKVDQTQKFETVVKPELETDLGSDIRLTVIGRIRHDGQKKLDTDKATDAELREFYVETNMGRIFLTLGKQQIVWGKADGLKVLDVVNPQEWREFILDDFDDSRIPLWTVNSEIPIHDVTLQLLWIPDQTYHEFASGDDLFAFTSPTLAPQAPPGVEVAMQAAEKPSRIVQDADWGMRLSTFWRNWDLTLNYLYHYNDTPVLYRQLSMTTDGPLATITPRYERSQLFGATFSNAFGDFTLRGEVGYTMDRYISTNALSGRDGVVKTNELAYVIGLDWFGISDTLLSAQLFQSRLSDDEPGMIRDETDTTITFLIKRDFMNETLSTELLWLYNINFDDGLARPKVTYQFTDEVTLWFGADLFYGDQTGLFGQFKKRDRIVSAVEVSF